MSINIKSNIPACSEDIVREEPFMVNIDNVVITSRLLNTVEYENIDMDFRRISLEYLIHNAVVNEDISNKDNTNNPIRAAIKSKLLKSDSKGFRKLIRIILKYSNISGLTWINAFIHGLKHGKFSLNPYVYWIMSHITIDELSDFVYYYIQYNISVKKKLLALYQQGVKAFPAKPIPLVSIECVPNLLDFHSLGEWI